MIVIYFISAVCLFKGLEAFCTCVGIKRFELQTYRCTCTVIFPVNAYYAYALLLCFVAMLA